MSLFRTIPTPGDFGPLFRLLDDYDFHRSSQDQKISSIRSFTPRFDVRESTDAYYLDGELPGIAQKDIDIEFTEGQNLVIKGRVEREYHSEFAPEADEVEKPRKATKEVTKTSDKTSVDQHKYWVSERSVGEFHRSFSFPARIDQDNVKASLKNGILSVVVPKMSASAGKKITIE